MDWILHTAVQIISGLHHSTKKAGHELLAAARYTSKYLGTRLEQ